MTVSIASPGTTAVQNQIILDSSGFFDFSHWAFQVGVIYTVCGIDGHIHARFEESHPMNWVWHGTAAWGGWARE